MLRIPLSARVLLTTLFMVTAVAANGQSQHIVTDLNISTGTISPFYEHDVVQNYTAAVSGVSSITVTVSFDSMNCVTVNGQQVASGSASQSIPLNPGNTVITFQGYEDQPCGGDPFGSSFTLTVTRLFQVTSLADDGGAGELRQVLAAAPAGATITFAAGLTGTIALTSELPAITQDVTIKGPGADNLTIDAKQHATVFTINSGTVSISGLTITGGKSTGGAGTDGGGTDGVVLSSGAGGSAAGGIWNQGTLTLSDCTLTGNTGNGGTGGETGGVTSTNLIAGAGGVGTGGIYNGGTLTLSNSTLANNTGNGGTGGQGANGGSGTSTGGGGGFGAGGIYSSGTLTLSNDTLTNNASSGGGGGLGGNDGGSGGSVSGIYNSSGAPKISNSILSACSGSGCPTTGDGNGNLVGGTVALAPLGNAGAPPQTMVPLPGSAAICAGVPSPVSGNSVPATDERGVARPHSYGGVSCIDVGAVQSAYSSVQFVPNTSFTGSVNTAVATPAAPVVSVIENGTSIGGVPLTLSFSGNGTATGLTATTIAGTGATFSNLVVNAAGPSDELTVAPLIYGTYSLPAATASLNIAYPTPTVTGILPSSGPAAGGTSVVIAGTNFTAATIVDFGGKSASYTINSATQITATSPQATAAGAVDVIVTNPSASSATGSADKFTYVVPTITVASNPSTLPGGTYGTTYPGATFTASEGAPSSYSYAVSAGVLPSGLSLSPVGMLSGTPTAAGSYSFTITATDGNNYTGSQAYTLVIAKATLAVTINPASMTYGGTYPAFTGTAATLVNGDTAASVGLAYATTPATTNTSAPGTYSITATITSTNYALTVATGTLVISKATATVTLSNLAQTYTGSALSATATTTPPGLTVGLTYNGVATAPTAAGSYAVVATVNDTNYAGTASGTLAIGKATATVMLSNLSQTYTGSALAPTTATTPTGLMVSVVYSGSTQTPTAVGSYPFTATINNANYAGTASGTLVIGKATASVTLGSLNQTYTGSALSATTTTTPSGLTVGLTYNGVATAPTAAGNYAVVATVNDANYTGAASGTLTIGKASLSITANSVSKVYGTANPTFTGSVTGQQNGDTFVESFATQAVTLSPVATYTIMPSVTGTNLTDYIQSVSTGTLTVNQAGSTTTLSASSPSITPAQSVTLTAVVASVTSGVPTRTVSFYDGTTLLSAVPLTNGTATLTLSTLAPGVTHALSAVYSGDTNFTGSSSTTAIGVTVMPLDFTLSLTGTGAQTVVPGSAVSYAFQLSPLYGSYAGTVSFSVAGLPPGATVTFSPVTVGPNSGPQDVIMTIKTAAVTARLESHGKLLSASLAMLLLPLFGVRRRKGLARLVCLLLMVGGAAATSMLTGCGTSNGFFAQAQQSYTVTVIAVINGSQQHSTTVTLVVE